jgi:SAM-dependent methyltransferase
VSVRSKLREAWARLRGGELTPWRAAASVAVGLAVGVTPLYGFHLPIVLAICVPLRLDAPIAYVAANISLPFLAPFLWLAEIEIGAWLRTGIGLALDVGGTLTYLVTASLTHGRAPDAIDAAIARVAERYARGRRAAFHYVRSKLASDPVARAVVGLGALAEVCDVGCGRGQLGVLLLEAGCADKVTGFDWDAAKVEDARKAAVGLAATFEAGDARSHVIAACDTVLLVDVLHYLTESEQDALLLRAAGAARRRVVLRDLDPDRGWRSRVTRIQEGITTALRFNRGANVRPRPIPALSRVLEDAGFDVKVDPCWGGTPFSNVLLVATRRESPGT